jgi:hypothetical protein
MSFAAQMRCVLAFFRMRRSLDSDTFVEHKATALHAYAQQLFYVMQRPLDRAVRAVFADLFRDARIGLPSEATERVMLKSTLSKLELAAQQEQAQQAQQARPLPAVLAGLMVSWHGVLRLCFPVRRNARSDLDPARCARCGQEFQDTQPVCAPCRNREALDEAMKDLAQQLHLVSWLGPNVKQVLLDSFVTFLDFAPSLEPRVNKLTSQLACIRDARPDQRPHPYSCSYSRRLPQVAYPLVAVLVQPVPVPVFPVQFMLLPRPRPRSPLPTPTEDAKPKEVGSMTESSTIKSAATESPVTEKRVRFEPIPDKRTEVANDDDDAEQPEQEEPPPACDNENEEEQEHDLDREQEEPVKSVAFVKQARSRKKKKKKLKAGRSAEAPELGHDELLALATAWVEGDPTARPPVSDSQVLFQASMAVLRVNNIGGYTELKLPCWKLTDAQSELLALATFLKLALCTNENLKHFENYHMSWGLWCFLPREQRDALISSWAARTSSRLQEASLAAYARMARFGDEELRFVSDCVVFCDSTPEFSTVRNVLCALQSWCQAPSCAHALLVALIREHAQVSMPLDVRVNPVLGLALGFNLANYTFWE